MNRTLTQLLATGFAVLATGCMGPILTHRPKQIDLTFDEGIWGDLHSNNIVRLKRDLVLHRSGMLDWSVSTEVAKGVYHNFPVEDFKANPERWPDYSLVQKGTRLRGGKRLIWRKHWPAGAWFNAYVEILDGPHQGRIVEVGPVVYTVQKGQGVQQLRLRESVAEFDLGP
jgi:hypothetical protein